MIVTVTIPIYKTTLEPYELMALSTAIDKFSRRDIVIACPVSLDLSPLQHMFTHNCRVERFDPGYFAGREGYNRLMLSRDFYSRFAQSRFVLVCQTDVLIFDDQLDYWCDQDYDYIGAPWLPAPGEVAGWNLFQRASYGLRRLYGKIKPGFHAINLKWQVGNGGLSLRRVSAMIEVVDAHDDDIAAIAANKSSALRMSFGEWEPISDGQDHCGYPMPPLPHNLQSKDIPIWLCVSLMGVCPWGHMPFSVGATSSIGAISQALSCHSST